MAKSARQTVFEGMELLPEALIPFVEKRLEATVQGHWQVEVVNRVHGLRPNSKGEIAWDQANLLKTMMVFWKDSFAGVLGPIERSIVSELLEVRNRLSHNEPFSYDDAERALDSMRRLMEAISAGEVAAKLGRMRDTILRTKYRELARSEERRVQNPSIQTGAMAGLLPWREVVEPHPDVATGNFQQAEFAADL
ncbi:MAG: AAA family ATPase, partial [Gammaproteobacteria bacterium]